MRKNKVISFGFLSLAFIFFCNPGFNVFDILPDCFACLFMVAAISKLGDLCDDLGEAKRSFLTLFWINISKLPALVIVVYIAGSNMNEGTMWLVLAFCYAIADAVFTVRAFNQLFDGLAYLGTRNNGGEFLYHRVLREEKQIKLRNGNIKVRPERIWRLESLSGFTSLFVIVKAACSTLPEFVRIYRTDEINNFGYAYTEFIPHLYVLLGVVATAFGIAWVIKTLSYVSDMKRHADFWTGLGEKYKAEVLPRRGIFIMRYVNVFAIILSAAVFFSVDLYLDEINVLPDFISAALFFAAACVVGKYSGGAASLKFTSVIYFITSAFTFVAMIMFKTGMFSSFGYYYKNVHSVDAARELYTLYAVSNALTQVAFVAVMMSAAAVMLRIVHEHTGINTLTGTSNSSRPLEKVYAAKIMRMRIFSIIAAIMSVLYFYLIVYADRVPLRDGRYVYMPRFEIVWMVDFVVGMIFAIHASSLVSDLVSEVACKYKYE
ncbi:MAG: hypothetical protein E7598_08280 [Ruminococcaceae bacterium]|nr:hypothetical protein [Oscillospiraceae bacterium]